MSVWQAPVARWFRIVWRGSGGTLAVLMIGSVFTAVLSIAFPYLWQFVVDEVRQGADLPRLHEIVGWMVGVAVAHAVLYTVVQGLRTVMNHRIQWRARRTIFAHLTRVDPDFFRRWRSGDVLTRLTDDAGEKVAWFLCSGIFRAYESVFVAVAAVIAMLTIDPVLTAWVVLPLPLLLVGQATAQGALGRRYRAVQRAISDISDHLTSTFSGIRVVQSASLQDLARKRFADRAHAQQVAEVRSVMVQQAVFFMYGYGWQLAVVALLMAGGDHVLSGQITLGEYVAFEGLTMALVWPMFDVGIFVSKYKQTAVALDRLDEVMAEPAARVATDGRRPEGRVLQAEGLSFALDGTDLLAGVDLTLRPGSLVAVVGEVASGKSTLVDLLAGARAATSGTVRLGGDPIDDVDTALRCQVVARVPQDPVLLSETVRTNVLLGREVDAGDLDRAVTISRLRQDLPLLPDGLDTRVGERGVTLSGGQKQRVALARALVGRPDVLLLDDATAALDADTEAAFWDQLEGVLPGVAALVVTHRVATIRRADAVVVLEGGRVVQVGRHDALMSTDGPYRRIYGRFDARRRAGL